MAITKVPPTSAVSQEYTNSTRQPSTAGARAEHRRDRQPSVSVVIPTLNEARNLEHVFAALPAGLHEVILVDGHSTDGTPDIARQLLPGRPA